MGTFTVDMAAFCKGEAPKKLAQTVRKMEIEIGNRLVMRSPVGDPKLWSKEFVAFATDQGWIGPGYVGGRFRANWQYGFNLAPQGALNEIDKTGASSINRIVSAAIGNKSFGVVHIVNNLPYAQALEDGHSRQAPQGMVSLVALEFPEIVRMATA